jgi:hypothetical protein
MRASRVLVAGRGVWSRLRTGEVSGVDQGWAAVACRAGDQRHAQQERAAARGESSGGQGRAAASVGEGGSGQRMEGGGAGIGEAGGDRSRGGPRWVRFNWG